MITTTLKGWVLYVRAARSESYTVGPFKDLHDALGALDRYEPGEAILTECFYNSAIAAEPNDVVVAEWLRDTDSDINADVAAGIANPAERGQKAYGPGKPPSTRI